MKKSISVAPMMDCTDKHEIYFLSLISKNVHLYTEMTDIKRSLHWDENEDKDRKIKWHEREVKSINRLNELINNKLNGSYGLGIDRNLKEYEGKRFF